MQTALARRVDPNAADDLAADLADFASGLDPARLPASVGAAVRGNILDTLACAVAGPGRGNHLGLPNGGDSDGSSDRVARII